MGGGICAPARGWCTTCASLNPQHGLCSALCAAVGADGRARGAHDSMETPCTYCYAPHDPAVQNPLPRRDALTDGCVTVMTVWEHLPNYFFSPHGPATRLPLPRRDALTDGRVTYRLLLTYKATLTEAGKYKPTMPLINKYGGSTAGGRGHVAGGCFRGVFAWQGQGMGDAKASAPRQRCV